MVVRETSAVQFGRTRIEYGIRRSPRRKTVAVAVEPGHGVLLTAPVDVSVKRLDRVVHDKARWLVDRLRLVGQAEPGLPPREFVSGESYLYLGRQYRLRVLPRAGNGDAKLDRGWLTVPMQRSLEGRRRSLAVREALVAWFRQHSAQRLPERVSRWYRKVGVQEPQVLIRDQQKRWGSCDAKGNLRINWRIIQAPMRLVDYVVVHELVHLLHKDHTKEFWAALGRVMPDYDHRREELRRLGRRLEW